MELSLVLPCYDEAEHIDRSVPRLLSFLDAMALDYEVVFVDDASRDDTRERLARLVARNPDHRLRVLHHARNRGRGAAVRDGFLAARGEILGYLDVDLEVDAVYVLSMLMAIRGGADVAVGARVYRVQPRFWHRHLLSRGYSGMTRRLLDVPFRDTEAGYKFFRRDVALDLIRATVDEGWFWDTEMMCRAHERGLAVREVPCLFQRNPGKTSTVRPFHDSAEYLRNLLRYRARRRREAAAGVAASPGGASP